MIPFLFGIEQSCYWASKLHHKLVLTSLMLFLPNPAHWEWMFAEHSREEWAQGSASALWDWKTGTVLYADGIHTLKSIRANGQPLREWLETSETE